MNVSFDEESYSVNERDGFIEQCVVLDGQIQREVVVYLSTLDGSAKGMIVNLYNMQAITFGVYYRVRRL